MNSTPLANPWTAKTLANFQQQAQREPSGIAFEAQHQMLAVCVTDARQIALVEKVIDLDQKAKPTDWTRLTLAEMATRAATEQGLGYETIRDTAGQRTSIVLCAITPEMVGLLQRLFQLKS